MLTMENTEGFNQETLDEMNEAVKRLMFNYEETYGDRDAYLKWAEESVLKRYGGA